MYLHVYVDVRLIAYFVGKSNAPKSIGLLLMKHLVQYIATLIHHPVISFCFYFKYEYC